MGSDNLASFKRFLFCVCGAGVCDLRRLKNDPNRLFYKCLAPHKQCSRGKKEFLKWADEVGENDEFISVPNCGGCNAGRCRVGREKVGPNAGKIVFMCTIKEGQGSCGYKVYQDELPMMQQVDSSSTLHPFASNGYDDIFDPEIVDLVMTNGISEKGPDNESPVVITPKHLQRCEASRKMKQLQCQEMELGESSTVPRKRSRDGEYKGVSPGLNSPTAVQAGSTVNSGKSTPVTKTPARSEYFLSLDSIIIEHDQNRVKSTTSPNPTINLPQVESSSMSLINKSTNAKVQHINPNVPSQPDNVIPESMSKAYGQAAELLQSKFLTFLKKMEAKDHESMNREANVTFSVLDGLFIDYRHFKEQVMELINSAKLLHEMEESIPENDSVLKLVDRFNSQRKKLDEINSAHAKAVDTVENSRKRVKVLKDEISLTKDKLVRAEADLLCSEVELRKMENQLEQICKEKVVLKGKCVVASQEYENCMELRGVTEAERDAAKDAFDRARMSLRG